MKKVLWFSRHQMTEDQLKSLGNVEVVTCNGNATNVHTPFECEMNGVSTIMTFRELFFEFDIIAVVMPINLQQQVMNLGKDIAKSVPVIIAKTNRVLVKNDDGSEDKVIFQFAGWERLVKIEVVTEPFNVTE